MSTDPNELRKRLAVDLSAAMAATEPTAEELGKRRRRGPALRGIKAAELAARLGVGYDAVLDWLAGRTEPSRESRLLLCDFMGITEDVFIARYYLGSVTSAQSDPIPSPTVEAGQVAELAAQVAELQQIVKHLQDSLEAHGGTG